MINVIVNPKAGHDGAAKNATLFERYADEHGVQYEITYTNAPKHATELARAAVDEGCERIIVISGDGTLNEVVNGVLDSGVPVGVIPSGSGNDFSKLTGIPADPVEATRAALGDKVRLIDVGFVNGKAFLNVAGMGMDVNTLVWHRKLRFLGRGMLPYAIALLLALTLDPPLDIVLMVDGEPRRGRLLMASIANGQYFGGGMRVAPLAQPDDGLLDACIVERINFFRQLATLPSFIKGKHIECDFVTYKQCERVFIPGNDLLIQLDGELTRVSDAEFSIKKQALRLIVP